MTQRKAVVLLSGGLDSMLAAKLMLEQGVAVEGLYLNSPFGCSEDVAQVARQLGIPLKVVEKGMDYVDLVRNPKYGYGRNMNPCIDCRIYMFEAAHRVMEELGADFIVTGEVVGQRPMSQRHDALDLIDRDSEMAGLVVRPLSAKHLPPTRPETEGWIDREKLLDIAGRGRTVQLELAEAFGLQGYAPPAGGCLLTDANFSKKLSTFFSENADPDITEVRLLRYGRHVPMESGAHVILGRNREENRKLLDESRKEVSNGKMASFRPLFSGPVAILSGNFSGNFAGNLAGNLADNLNSPLLDEVGRLITRYTRKWTESEYRVEVTHGSAISYMTLTPVSELELPVLS